MCNKRYKEIIILFSIFNTQTIYGKNKHFWSSSLSHSFLMASIRLRQEAPTRALSFRIECHLIVWQCDSSPWLPCPWWVYDTFGPCTKYSQLDIRHMPYHNQTLRLAFILWSLKIRNQIQLFLFVFITDLRFTCFFSNNLSVSFIVIGRSITLRSSYYYFLIWNCNFTLVLLWLYQISKSIYPFSCHF